jgi:hypothetical protein
MHGGGEKIVDELTDVIKYRNKNIRYMILALAYLLRNRIFAGKSIRHDAYYSTAGPLLNGKVSIIIELLYLEKTTIG